MGVQLWGVAWCGVRLHAALGVCTYGDVGGAVCVCATGFTCGSVCAHIGSCVGLCVHIWIHMGLCVHILGHV